ncbi:MAG: isopentenyl-diphosphate Delta-isomerase [Chitinophagaceae bacterium]
MTAQEVILVTENDEPTGTMDKMEAHRRGVLHRAFSVFIFNNSGRMLLQKRAQKKYHGGGLWSNACCSHPYPEEGVKAAAARRLYEELGFGTPLEKVFAFTYRAEVENNLIEHEYDHVFCGEYEGAMGLNEQEVDDIAYMSMTELELSIQRQPANFTSWFRIAFPQIQDWWRQRYGIVN